MFFNVNARRQSAPQQIAQPISFGTAPIAGFSVNDETAWRYSGFFACVRIISETCAYLPWNVYQTGGSKSDPFTEHSVNNVLANYPNTDLAPFYFKENILRNLMAHGNFYAEVERNRIGEVVALWPIDPWRVKVERDTNGRIVYVVKNQGLNDSTFAPGRMYHVRGPSRDGIIGMSIIEQARESISLGLAANAFGASFLGNGALPAIAITNKDAKAELDPSGVKNLLKKWNQRNKGAKKMHGVEYLDKGLDIHEFGFSAKDAQFIETADYSIVDMCRWFRIPPHKLAKLDRATWNNIESQNIDFVTDAILPNTARMEGSANFSLLRGDAGEFYTRLKVTELLRGDSAARVAYYRELRNLGVINANEIRDLEDMDGIGEKGDKYLVNGASLDLEGIGSTPANGNQSGVRQAVMSLVYETSNRITKIELNAARRFDVRSSTDDIAKAYIKQAQISVDAFRQVANVFLEAHEKENENIEENLKSFFADYFGKSADELQGAILRGEESALLKSWDSSKSVQLSERFARFLLEK